MSALDKRLHAYRHDLADERLRGQVDAARFIAGTAAMVRASVAGMRGAPSKEAGVESQLLFGDRVRVFDKTDEWCWAQAERDSYVGYVATTDLGPAGKTATHVVAVPRSFVYPAPDLKLPVSGRLSMGSEIVVEKMADNRGTAYAVLDDGRAMIASHLRPFGEHDADYVAVAETFEWTPYLWGGSSAFGLDCSGLVQLALRMTGKTAPRDSDMQGASLGQSLDPGDGLSALRRGDLVFWKGHVAIMTDNENIIHANGRTMMTTREKLTDAIDRIAFLFDRPTGFRRCRSHPGKAVKASG